MQVQALSREDLIQGLRRRADDLARSPLPSARAAHDELVQETRWLSSFSGDTVPEIQQSLEAYQAGTVRTRNRAALLGLGMTALSGAGMVAAGGISSSIPLMILQIASLGVVAGCGIVGGFAQAEIGTNRERMSTLERWSRELSSPDPALPTLEPVPVDPSPGIHTAEMVQLLKAAEGQLSAGLDHPGFGAALKETRSARQRLETESMPTLPEVCQAATNRAARRQKTAYRMGLAGLGCMIGSLGCLFAGAAIPGAVPFSVPVMLASLAFAVEGNLLLKRAREDHRYVADLTAWGQQLDQLKQDRRLVGGLVQPPSGGPVELNSSFVQIGGVRVPVKAAGKASAA